MQVQRINEIDGEVELKIDATANDVDMAFENGLESFIVQFHLESLPGDTPMEKIQKAMSPEEARDAITSAVISALIPFALNREEIIPMTTSAVDAQSDPKQGEPFSFTIKVLPKPSFELTDYAPVEVIVAPKMEVTEADIDRQIHMLASNYAIVKVDPETGEEITELPDIDDDWVKFAMGGEGISTVDQLRQKFRETSEQVMEEQFEASKMSAIMEEYINRFDGEVSPKMIDAMTEELFEAFQAELARSGMTLMEFKIQQKTNDAQIKESLRNQARLQCIQGFVLDAIFRHEDLKLELSDLMSYLRNIAPGNEEAMFDSMEKTGRISLLKEAASRLKATAWLIDNCKVKVLEPNAALDDACSAK